MGNQFKSELLINYPEVIKYWDFEKNKDENINTISIGNQKSFFWKCPDCNHEWKTRICHLRYDSHGCPNCNKIKKKRIELEKNKSSVYLSNIIDEWDYEKNININPKYISINDSRTKVYWKCEKNHSYITTPYLRSKGSGCPYCSNKKILRGYNDLATTNPELLEIWNYEKNIKITPQDLTYGSGKKVWWKCSKGHEWFESVNTRYPRKNTCPICNQETQVSFPEKAIYYYALKYFDNVIENYRSDEIMNKEIDIFLKEKKIGIEYDGEYYHKDRQRDIKKDKICDKIGIKLYHIVGKKQGKLTIKNNYIYYKYPNNNDLSKAIKILFLKIDEKKDYIIDVNKDAINIYNQIEYYKKDKSLLEVNYKIAKEWNYEKNGNLKPENVFSGSQKKVWWKCSKGHEWIADINSRISGNGCPYCSNQKILQGYNDLATTNPELLKDWDYDKNNIFPTMIGIGSTKKVWWKCQKGHSFYTAVNVRKKGCNCPYCANQKTLQGYNDLATTNPELLKEWNYEKNKNVKLENINQGSRKKVWWKCSKGHEWIAEISSRALGRGCPYCANQKILQGYNDLATTNPELLKEWNYEKNNLLNITPKNVSANSGRKVWWKCLKGHEWQVRIADKNRYKTSCPYCSNKKILQGYNDLATTNPELLKFWDYKKNEIKPIEIGKGSGKKVWWHCPKCNNEWIAKIVEVNNNQSVCQNCKKN